MKADGREGSSTATTVYRILQSPAPICMFYFAHPFGISSPAATSGSTSSKAVPPKAPKIEPSRKPVPLPAPKYDRQASKTEIVRQRPESRDEPKKPNGMTMRFEKPTPKPVKPPESRPKLKKTKNSNAAAAAPGPAGVTTNGGGHRVSRTPLTVKPHAKTKKRPNVIELDTRQTPLTPWPSTIWNRDFLIPPLLQVLAKQHGRKIPDIEQILRTVRSAWNTPKSQRSLSQRSPFPMDQPCSSLSAFWTSFKTEESYTPVPDYRQPARQPSEYPSYYDIATFYDSVAYGNRAPCYVKPDYPFSGEAPTHCSNSIDLTDDDPLDQNNNTFCDLTTYQDLENFPQRDLNIPVVQDAAPFSTSESSLSPFLQDTNEMTLELVENLFLVDESSIPASTKQGIPVIDPHVVQFLSHVPLMEVSNIPVPIKEEIVEKIPAVSPLAQESLSKLPLEKVRKVGKRNKQGKYQCPSCDRLFNHQGNLTQHFNAHHRGPMGQRCSICGKRFHLRDELEVHQLRHKEQNKPLKCEYCPKKFNYHVDMTRHVQSSHTGAPYSCQFCGKPVVRPDHLKLHEDTHRRRLKKADNRKEMLRIRITEQQGWLAEKKNST